MLAGALLAAGCEPAPTDPEEGTGTATTEPEGAGVLRWALGSDPTSLDPAQATRDDDELLADALFDGLTRLGPDLMAQPALATEWTRDADATTFTFRLDPDARWHDGSPVVAADVVRGLQRVADGTMEPPSPHAHLLGDVSGFAGAQVGQPLRGVTAIDDETVRVELADPVPELPEILSHPALAPVPPMAVETPRVFAEAPVGNGPFVLAEPWAHNQFLRLAPSATHPDPSAVEEVVFRIYGSDDDRAIRHADLLAGQIQVSQLPSGRRDDVVGGGPIGAGEAIELMDGLTDTASILLFDTRQAPLDDVRFRRGVSMLIDRESLAGRTDGARSAARSLVPPGLPGAGRAVCAWCRHDPDAGAALIEQALAARGAQGNGDVAPIVLQTSTDALHSTLADQLSAALRGVGLEVRVVRADAADYLTTARQEAPAVIRLGWTADEPTLRAWTERLFGAGSTGARLTGWQPASLRDLLANAAASSDRDFRRRTWQQVERLALDAAVVAPVLHYHDDLLVDARVDGLQRDPYGNVDLAQVSVPPPGP